MVTGRTWRWICFGPVAPAPMALAITKLRWTICKRYKFPLVNRITSCRKRFAWSRASVTSSRFPINLRDRIAALRSYQTRLYCSHRRDPCFLKDHMRRPNSNIISVVNWHLRIGWSILGRNRVNDCIARLGQIWYKQLCVMLCFDIRVFKFLRNILSLAKCSK